jgi:hypothetical protein
MTNRLSHGTAYVEALKINMLNAKMRLTLKSGVLTNFKWLYSWAQTLNNVKQLIFVMVKCGVLFEVRTEFLNNI